MNREATIAERVARDILAADFPREQALKDYLKAHPGASRSDHRINKYMKDKKFTG